MLDFASSEELPAERRLVALRMYVESGQQIDSRAAALVQRVLAGTANAAARQTIRYTLLAIRDPFPAILFPVVPALVAQSGSEYPFDVLGKMASSGSTEARAELLRCMSTHKDTRMRISAGEALISIDKPQRGLWPAISDAILHEGDAGVRRQFISAILKANRSTITDAEPADRAAFLTLANNILANSDSNLAGRVAGLLAYCPEIGLPDLAGVRQSRRSTRAKEKCILVLAAITATIEVSIAPSLSRAWTV